FRKFARRNKAVLATAAAVAAALVVVVGSLVTAVTVLAAGNAEVKEKQRQTKDALRREQQANEELLRAVSFQCIARAERELAANNIGHAEELLAEVPAAFREWEWHFLKRWPHERPHVLKAGKVWIMALAYSADGRH